MQDCIYLRKSRADAEAEAHGEGETLARHEKTLLDLAKRLKLNITQIYREVVSGETIAARPVMQQLLSEVEQGIWSGVLVMDVDRLARGDTIDQGIVSQTFKLSGTKIITPTKTYDPDNEFDEEYFEFGLFMSRREYKTINRRLQRGKMASINEGKYIGSIPPYGYRRVKLKNEKGWTLEPEPEEAEIVRLIFQLYTVGEAAPDGTRSRIGVSRIATRLNSMGLHPRKGPDWTPPSIRGILANPVYIGMIRWNYRPIVKRMEGGKLVKSHPRKDESEIKVIPGRHPPIISEETFNLAQQFTKANRAAPLPVGVIMTNPLAGLIVCGKCGRHMQKRPTGQRNSKELLYCPYPSCTNVGSNLVLVEERLLQGLSDWLEEYRVQWASGNVDAASASEAKRKMIKSQKAELANLERQIGKVHDLLERGVYDVDTFLERSRLINERSQAIRADIERLEVELRDDIAREESRTSIIPKVSRLLEVYGELSDPVAKNEMLKEVVDKAVYTKEVSARWHGTPDGFKLVLYPKIPYSK